MSLGSDIVKQNKTKQKTTIFKKKKDEMRGRDIVTINVRNTELRTDVEILVQFRHQKSMSRWSSHLTPLDLDFLPAIKFSLSYYLHFNMEDRDLTPRT